MEKVDYIIVGLGIAGISLAEKLRKQNKRFVVFDYEQKGATHIAGGTINPVTLKWFTPAWKALQFLETALPFYKELEERLGRHFFSDTSIWRIFNSVEEQNNWSAASDKILLSNYLSAAIQKNNDPAIEAKYGFGIIQKSYLVDTSKLLSEYQKLLQNEKAIRLEAFEYSNLKIQPEKICYKNIIASKIVFAEGTSAINNPFFPNHILFPNKGEYITIKAPKLTCDVILKGTYYVIPLGNHLYKIGATFAHGDATQKISQKGKQDLLNAVKKIITVPFDVVFEESGMRPTVIDRKPILGLLPNVKNVYFFNGLGTRGLLMAPLLAAQLYHFMENGIALPKEIDIQRFTS